jgi:hypothetical protein
LSLGAGVRLGKLPQAARRSTVAEVIFMRIALIEPDLRHAEIVGRLLFVCYLYQEIGGII